MKHIVISGEAGKKLVQKLKKAKEAAEEKIESKFPPEEVREWMKKKADETNELNGGTLDKSTFMLGMMTMWSYLNKKEKNG